MNIPTLAAGLHPLERKVVPHLEKKGSVVELANKAKMLEVEAMRALQWLENKGCVKISTAEKEFLLITKQGQEAAEKGLPETFVLAALQKKEKLYVSEISKVLPSYDKGAVGAAVGALKKMGVPFVTDSAGKPMFKWIAAIKVGESAAKKALVLAKRSEWKLAIDKNNKELVAGVQDLLKRKGYAHLAKVKAKSYQLTEVGASLQKSKALAKEYDERLTHEMLATGKWREFRPYNVTINVPQKTGGMKHPVTQAIEYIKKIWLELGFQEMEGEHVQSAFWDLDALFVPQDHPAREMQDTFYLLTTEQSAAHGSNIDPAVFKAVKSAHENGGKTGSLGWRYQFSKEESEKLLLRTHTTVLSAQTLDKIRKGELKEGKYFAVSNVYRNEALDWKHLFEFHQVEGIVVGKNLHLGNLKGYLKEFFGKMGFPDVRIRPAHFPYTEPSAEVDVYDPRKKQWVELGGSGIFRPEVTEVLTGDKELSVLAWGLGMERIIKEYYGLTDIRDLYRNDLAQLREMKVWLK